MPIYYTQDSAINQDDIAGMNSNKKNWTMMDYINFYAVKGKQEYITFSQFCHKHSSLKPSLLITLCSSNGTRNTDSIREGILDIGNIEKAEELIKYLEDFAKLTSLAYSSRFIEAVRIITNSSEYDHERMLKKIEADRTAIVPCSNKKQYVQILQALYNKGVREQNIVIFLKR